MRCALLPWTRLLLAGLVLATAGCAREDGSKIIGHWRAERFQVMSLKLPIGPELTISRDTLKAGSELTVPIEAITQDGDEITLDMPMHVGLSFQFVDDDRMYVDVPFIDRIYYRRVDRPAGLAARPAQPPAPASAPQTDVAEQAPAAGAAPAFSQPDSYALALDAARRGDQDTAVRMLHRAFQEGSARAAEVQSRSEFDGLRDDVRFQALLARHTVR
ncbi:MAG: TPR end-of-group domain-containing protein [Janthinobacterium lividum]